MRKLIVIFALVIFVFSLANLNSVVYAASDVEITANETSHTVVMPLEKSFIFVATIQNNGSSEVEIQSTPADSSLIPNTWHILSPTGRYKLSGGQHAQYLAIFEPGADPSGQSKEESVTVPISFTWQGGSKKFDVTVKTKNLSQTINQNNISTSFSVKDKSGKNISGATIIASLPSGMQSFMSQKSNDKYSLSLPSGEYLSKSSSEYKINHSTVGYYLQVYAQGYKNYFEDNYLPQANKQKTITLEKLDQVGNYSLTNTIETGYSIWWIRASQDEKYFAISQGMHDSPSEAPSSSGKIVLADSSGKKIWENTTGGVCWGLDIAPDASHVAAGCHDGKIYVWDKDGKQIWENSNNQKESDANTQQGVRVRWIKFSPDGNYILTGPVEKTAEKAGLYETNTGKLVWSFYTGDWLREGRFSQDGKTAYLSSSNGTIYSVDATNGSFKWLGNGFHVIPFMLGLSESNQAIVSAGKGRAFTAINLADGTQKWQKIIDQTVTAAQTASDGSVVGSTVGGMSYGLNPDGSFKWVRTYGGVGHNGVEYTANGQYAMFGGPNPTLFDSKGNILWQREVDKAVNMTSVQEKNTGGANEVWVSGDGSLIILGGDDGKVQFYTGKIENGKNNYSQLTGMDLQKIGSNPAGSNSSSNQGSQKDQNTKSNSKPSIIWIIGGLIVIIVLAATTYFIVRKRKSLV